MLFELVVFSILLLLVLCRIQQLKLWKECKLVELPLNALPLVGHILLGFGNNEYLYRKWKKISRRSLQIENLTVIWTVASNYIVIVDPVHAEAVLKSCVDKGHLANVLKMITGNGTITAPVPIWRPLRKKLAHVFSHKFLTSYVTNMEKYSRILVEILNEKVGGEPFAMLPYMTNISFDAVCNSTLGIEINAQKDNPLFPKVYNDMSAIAVQRLPKPWFHNDQVFKLSPSYYKFQKLKKYIDDFVKQKVDSKIEAMRLQKESIDAYKGNEEKELKSTLDILLASGKFTYEETWTELVTLISAGYETSGATLGYMLLMLARNPDVQDKVVEELNSVFGEDDTDKTVTIDDIAQLKYLDCVMKETLRMFPPVFGVPRRIDQDISLPTGQTIPNGSTAVIIFWAIHHNKRYWGHDADIFRPERFFEPLKHPYQFLAFSGGPRNCTGYRIAVLTVKTVMAAILRKFRVLPADTTTSLSQDKDTNGDTKYKRYNCLEEPIRIQYGIISKPVDDCLVRLERR